MRQKQAKMGVLALVLVLCLAIVGVSYAEWSDTLTINGTVDTGKVAVEFSDCKSNDAEALTNVTTSPDPQERGTWTFEKIDAPGTWVWYGNTTAYDEAHTNVSIGNNGGPANSLLMIDMAGGYPGYCGHVAFSVDNVGTVPVDVESIKLTHVSKAGVILPVDVVLVKDQTKYVYIEMQYDEEGKYVEGTAIIAHVADSLQTEGENVLSEFSLTLSHLAVGDPVNPSGAIPGDLCYRVEQGSKSGTTYDFLIEIVASQWNE